MSEAARAEVDGAARSGVGGAGWEEWGGGGSRDATEMNLMNIVSNGDGSGEWSVSVLSPDD